MVIWLLFGDRDAITEDARAALEEPSNGLLLSAASVWEIAVKRSIGKLDIESTWADELLRLDLVHLPVTAAHAGSNTCRGTTATPSIAFSRRRHWSSNAAS